MTMLTERSTATELENSRVSKKNNSDETFNTLPLSYFDLLDEVPEFSEAAILLEDETIEYCYIKLGQDGSQYFGFNYCLPDSPEYKEIISRHKLENKMEANTFEKYPSGKTVLSRGGKVLQINCLYRRKHMSNELQPEASLKRESPIEGSRLTDESILPDFEKKALHEANNSKSTPSPEHPKVRRLKEAGFEVDYGEHKLLKGQVVEERWLENQPNNKEHTPTHIPDAHLKYDKHGQVSHFDFPAKPQKK